MQYSDKKIIYLTSGAGGMFCGSCLHDNALSRALSNQGWDIQLVPTYTPIRTDEDDFSVDQVLFGGINVFLQQKIPLFRHLPGFVDRFLNSPRLIRRVTSRAVETDAKMLGQLALSMLQGVDGNQRKEVKQVCQWVRLNKPDLLIFSNILIGGFIDELKRQLNIPILVTLQGDDVFLDSLQPPYKDQCVDRIKQIVSHVDGFVVQSEFFRQYMSDYFSIDPQKIHVTPLGLDVTDFAPFLDQANDTKINQPHQTIGYMARLAKEKGLHHLVDGFIKLKSKPDTDHIRLKIAGWLSPENEAYAQSCWKQLDSAGLSDHYEYLGAIERETKLDLFGEIDLLSVPTEYQEPKGLYALEALAAGVPVVLPAHGAFPELVNESGGGVLFEPHNTDELSQCWMELLSDDDQRKRYGQKGQAFIHQHRNAESMATATSSLIESFLDD